MGKKIIFLCFVILLTFVQNAAASERLLDMKSQDYYQIVANKFESLYEKYSATCSEMTYGGFPNNQTFFIYRNNVFVEVWIAEDKDGYIKTITWQGISNAKTTRISTIMLLYCAGLTANEICELYNGKNIYEEKFEKYEITMKEIWSSKLNKKVFLSFGNYYDGRVAMILQPGI